ncbi:MAG: hypothetical protein HYY62_02510 [Deltaproteobacteria bacterium]|nr:hypothetical protein [Deltaproteobacteria bacterium]
MKKIILYFSLLLIFGVSLTFAKQRSLPQPAKKTKDNPVAAQCDKSSQNAPHPETWAACCKGHGGKVKKEAKEGKEGSPTQGWDCDAESEAKAKELAGDEEDAEQIAPPEESDESVSQ